MPSTDLFTRREAVASGTSDWWLHHMARTGAISRVARGVYRPGPDRQPDAEAIARSIRGSISHGSAVRCLGSSLVAPPTTLDITVERCRGRWKTEIPGVTLHRADTGPADVITIDGLPVTAPLRTSLDIARSMPLTHSVAAIDSLVRRGLLTTHDVLEAATGLPPAPARRSAMRAAALIDPRSESVFESVSRVSMALAGLPAPIPQLNIRGSDGRWIARVDFGWEEQRVILECDGYEYHGDRAAFERDRRRWTALTRAGWRVVIVSWRDVLGDPDYLIEVMSDVLGVATTVKQTT